MSLVLARGLFPGNRGGSGPGGCGATNRPNIGGYSSIQVGYGYDIPIIQYLLWDEPPGRPLEETELRAMNNTTVKKAWGPRDTNSYAWTAPESGVNYVNVWARNCHSGDFVVLDVSVQNGGFTTGAPRFITMRYTAEFPIVGTIGDFILWHADDDGSTVWTMRDEEHGSAVIAQGSLSAAITWPAAIVDSWNSVSITAANGSDDLRLYTAILVQDNA